MTNIKDTSEFIGNHIRNSDVFSIDKEGNIMLNDSETIVNQLVNEGFITIDDLVKCINV